MGLEPNIGCREAAQLLGVSAAKIKLMVYAKEIPHMRIGSRILFLASVLDEWRQKQIVESCQPCVAAGRRRK